MVAGSGLAEFLNSSIFSSPGAEHPRWLPRPVFGNLRNNRFEDPVVTMNLQPLNFLASNNAGIKQLITIRMSNPPLKEREPPLPLYLYEFFIYFLLTLWLACTYLGWALPPFF